MSESRHATPRCPECGRKLKVSAVVYEDVFKPPYTRKRIGTKPANNLYEPFCTLRCGWQWAVKHIGRKGK